MLKLRLFVSLLGALKPECVASPFPDDSRIQEGRATDALQRPKAEISTNVAACKMHLVHFGFQLNSFTIFDVRLKPFWAFNQFIYFILIPQPHSRIICEFQEHMSARL